MNPTSIPIPIPLSPCQNCHFIKAQTQNIGKALQAVQKNQITNKVDGSDEENNAIDNFLFALKAPETKRQHPRRLKV